MKAHTENPVSLPKARTIASDEGATAVHGDGTDLVNAAQMLIDGVANSRGQLHYPGFRFVARARLLAAIALLDEDAIDEADLAANDPGGAS